MESNKKTVICPSKTRDLILVKDGNEITIKASRSRYCYLVYNIPNGVYYEGEKQVASYISSGWKIKEIVSLSKGGKKGKKKEGSSKGESSGKQPKSSEEEGGKPNKKKSRIRGGKRVRQSQGNSFKVEENTPFLKKDAFALKRVPGIPSNQINYSESAAILCDWVGGSQRSILKYSLDIVGLSRALEIGENPLPYLSKEMPAEKTIKLVITYDESGSTHNTSSSCKQWAEEALKMPNIEVAVISNFNGHITPEDFKQIDGIDYLVYLGDQDPFHYVNGKCEADKWFSLNENLKVIVLSNVGHNNMSPRIVDFVSNHNIVAIDGVTFENSNDMVEAMKLASQHVGS